MKAFLRYKLWPVIAGLITASVVMLACEYINSFFFSLPADLDWNDPAAVQAFTQSLPWTAYILVLIGYVLGSFKGGCVTTYLARENTYRMSLALGILLTLGGILNVLMIGHPAVFTVLSLPTFLIFTYLGHRYLRNVKGPAAA